MIDQILKNISWNDEIQAVIVQNNSKKSCLSNLKI